MQRFLTVCIAGITFFLGCYPKYVDHTKGGNGSAVVVEGEPLGGPLIVEMQAASKCIGGTGWANVVAMWDLEHQSFAILDGLKTINCSEFAPLSSDEFYTRFESVRTEGEMVSPKVPILKRAPGRGAYSKSGRSCLFVSSDSEHIQVIYGTYGNREGAETEHIYSVTKERGKYLIRTETLMKYTVQLEMLSDF